MVGFLRRFQTGAVILDLKKLWFERGKPEFSDFEPAELKKHFTPEEQLKLIDG